MELFEYNNSNENLRKIRINIYADESKFRRCNSSKNRWFYTGIIFEIVDNSLLDDLINLRYNNNFDKDNIYYEKNNKILHWTEINSLDQKFICERWFKYILDPSKSGCKFYFYLLGINESKLDPKNFGDNNEFNTFYNRFFRTAIEYGIKTFFPNDFIEILNIYHEQGEQEKSMYFPWHSIFTLEKKLHSKCKFYCSRIEFLSKDHNQCPKANVIQLIDCFMGAIINIIHGLEKPNSKRSKLKSQLMDLIFPLVERMANEPGNPNSRYQHHNRIIMRFFPKSSIEQNPNSKYINNFYTNRTLKYQLDCSGQLSLDL